MHIYPGALVGISIWIATLTYAHTKLWAILSGPVIVSGVALVLALAPEISRARPWTSATLGVMAAALLVFVGSVAVL